MSDLLYVDAAYCTLCDRYFPGNDARRHHVQMSINHPKCDTCDRRFANKNSLRSHLVVSPRHNWCAVCERDFRTPAGLRVHIEYAAVHRDDSDDDSDDEEIDDSAEGWEDELGLTRFPNEQHPSGGEIPDSDVDYWTDDDDEQFEEELDAYDGFARVPPLLRSAESSASPFSDEHSAEHQAEESCQRHDSEHAHPPVSSTPSPAVLVSCPLCLEAPKATSATKCGHLFCTSCIKMALSKKKMCPVCRDFSLPKDLRKIYLPGCLLTVPAA